MQNFKEWLLKMLSNNDDVSSKRIMGTILLIWGAIVITTKKPDMADVLIYAGLALFGITAAEKIFKKEQ